jgi:hypothetical protein
MGFDKLRGDVPVDDDDSIDAGAVAIVDISVMRNT